MSSEKAKPLLGGVAQDEEVDCPTKCKRGCYDCVKTHGKQVCLGCGGLCLVIFVLMWILQFILSGFYLWGCSAKYWKDGEYNGYKYRDGVCTGNECEEDSTNKDFGASATSKAHKPIFNILHRSMVLKESKHTWKGASFNVYDIQGGSNDIFGAPKGKWWRKWGPWFTTYYYQESSGSYPKLIYMRKKLLSLSGDKHIVGRCDELHPPYVFQEGSHWFGNMFAGWSFADKGWQFDILQDDKFAATAVETQDAHNLNFFSDKAGSSDHQIATSSLHQEGGKHSKTSHTAGEWNVENIFATSDIPYYLPNAITLLLAFKQYDIEHSSDSSDSKVKNSVMTLADMRNETMADLGKMETPVVEKSAVTDKEEKKVAVAIEEASEEGSALRGTSPAQTEHI